MSGMPTPDMPPPEITQTPTPPPHPTPVPNSYPWIPWGLPAGWITPPNYKYDLIQKIGEITAIPIPVTAPVGSGGLYHIQVTDPTGQTVGTGGAGPCIGLIVITPNDGIFVYHFGPEQDPHLTLARDADKFAGAHIAFFGGDNTPESNATLINAVGFFKDNEHRVPVIWDGYSNTTGLWVQGGHYVTMPHDKTSTNTGGTSP